MASSRGVAHLSRELVDKLVGLITDPGMPAARKLDRASATLDRVIRDAESPASDVRPAVVGVLDDAVSTAAELTRSALPRAELEARIRAKLLAGLAELPGLSVEGRR